jgi:polysaccharide pyruvyl transferase WcaK-like protein
MGLVLAQIAGELGISSALRSYHLERYPAAGTLLMGGGELGDATHFGLLRAASPRPAQVGVHGINPHVNLGSAPEDLLRWLSGVRTLSARSRWGADLLTRLLGREVAYCPDLAFGLVPTLLSAESVPPAREQVLGINVTPFYMTVRRQRELVCDLSMLGYFKQYAPDFAAVLPRAGAIYLDVMRTIARTYTQRGWKVISVPMSGVDALAAHAALAGTGATLLPFHHDPAVTMRRIAGCTRLLACRFHAHVFALAAGVPTNSFAVANKSSTLWAELGLAKEAQVDRLSMVTDPDSSTARLLDGSLALTLDQQQRTLLAKQAIAGARESLLAMQPN